MKTKPQLFKKTWTLVWLSCLTYYSRYNVWSAHIRLTCMGGGGGYLNSLVRKLKNLIRSNKDRKLSFLRPQTVAKNMVRGEISQLRLRPG